jgi:hypothetical protein
MPFLNTALFFQLETKYQNQNFGFELLPQAQDNFASTRSPQDIEHKMNQQKHKPR